MEPVSQAPRKYTHWKYYTKISNKFQKGQSKQSHFNVFIRCLLKLFQDKLRKFFRVILDGENG